MKNKIAWLFAVLLSLNFHSVCAQEKIQIIEPMTGIVVKPGQALTITVTRSSANIKAVMLVGNLLSGRSGFSEIKSGQDPLAFQITVPLDKRPGKYRIGAVDVTRERVRSGPQEISAPLEVVVDIDSPILSVEVFPTKMELNFIGDEDRIFASAQLPDGTRIAIDDAAETTYTSLNTAVAQVRGHGQLIGTGEGNTKIIVQYKMYKAGLDVIVPRRIRGDLNGDGRVSRDDLGILKLRLGALASVPNDARDLDHDGRIDQKDAEILASLCVNPDCF